MAVFMIYKNFDFLIPDAPELIQTFMAAVRLPPSPQISS
jgi:coatomer subunit beta